MSESSLGPIHWLHGLEDYFEFSKDTESKKFVEFIIKLSYATDPIFKLSDTGSLHEFLFRLRQYAPAPMLETLAKFIRDGYNTEHLVDAFSRGQVKSKIWLATELAKISSKYKTAYILASWYGQLVNYMDIAGIHCDKIRLFDLDAEACDVSDNIFNFDKMSNSWQAKSVCMDLNDITWTKKGGTYHIPDVDRPFDESTMPDLIINTSSEHMSDEWFFKIKFKELESNPIVVIQSNNLFDVPEHINCVYSVSHLKKKFPMKEILFEGEIQLKGYKRFMLIGRP